MSSLLFPCTGAGLASEAVVIYNAVKDIFSS